MEWTFSVEIKTKLRMAHPQGIECPTPPSAGDDFCWKGTAISGRLADRFGSRFGTNTKSLRGDIGPISTTNGYLNVGFDVVISLCGSCRNSTFIKKRTAAHSWVHLHPIDSLFFLSFGHLVQNKQIVKVLWISTHQTLLRGETRRLQGFFMVS